MGMRDGLGDVLTFWVAGVILSGWFFVVCCVVHTGMRDGLGMCGGLGSIASCFLGGVMGM